MKIDNFKGEYFFLSNFYPTKIKYNGIQYLNNEAAFQAQKCTTMEDRIKFSCLNPSDAKRLGRRIILRNDWESVKISIMREIVFEKFKQNPECLKELLDTGNMELIEDTTGWHDNIWGECTCEECKNKEHKNYLGKILMEVREELKNYY